MLTLISAFKSDYPDTFGTLKIILLIALFIALFLLVIVVSVNTNPFVGMLLVGFFVIAGTFINEWIGKKL